MQHTTLGRTGLKVSKLCLGTMNFGPQTSEADSFAIMDRALELEVNFFDTADVYGWSKGEGVTERIIGNWFAQGGTRREQTVLATKVFGDMDNDDLPDRNLKRGLSARKIILECEHSLKRLQTDWIDVYQMHHIAREMPWEECWQAFETLIKQGKILYAGSSNFAGWHIAAANENAKRLGMLGLVSEQSKYSLLDRAIETDVLPACEHYGVGVIPWSPLAGGLLGGVLKKQAEGGRRASEQTQKRIEDLRPQLEKWESLCDDIGEKPADLAIAWMLQDDRVTAPIIGPRTIEQLEGICRAVDIKIDGGHMKLLDEIFPGPGGPAPEAYAW
ncbi:MAG: aldo/keto reductase [Planctomycetota bacterium]